MCSSWLTQMLSQHAKKNIYGAAMKKWSSFAVRSPTEIVHETSHPMLHDRKQLSCDTKQHSAIQTS